MNQSLPFPELLRPLQLLVVDDQEFDRTLIVTRLREVVPENTIIHESSAGAASIEIVTNNLLLDCVLLDLNLGDMHGTQLTKKLLHLRPELSIVIITVEADMDKALQCLQSGAEDFLIKGEYSNFGLYRTIRYAMERRRVSLENFRLNKALTRERELSRAQKEFIHFVSHEFRTPMAIISGAVQMLAAKIPELTTNVGVSQYNKINGALSRLELMLDDVIRLSRMEDGKDHFQSSSFDLSELAQELSRLVDSPRLTLEGFVDPIPFTGDRRYVEYALHNLISNALKYSPQDQPVVVRFEGTPEALVISVIDRGAGMSEMSLARVGEKFFRDASTSHIEGTGLGLHLTQRFMEHHNGRLSFDSAPGRGTTARLIFPVRRASIAARA